MKEIRDIYIAISQNLLNGENREAHNNISEEVMNRYIRFNTLDK